MDEENVIKCITSILDNGVSFTEELHSKMAEVKQYLEKLCCSLENLEEFLEDFDEHFIVENDRVAVYSSDLDSGREKAVEYYKGELKKEIEKYDRCPTSQNFRGHIGQADKDIQNYINAFYPMEEFKDFLLGHPEVFVVFDDDTVNLIETVCANYFQQYLRSDGIHFNDLQYYTSRAPDYIQNFIETYYAEDDFLEFLENNSNIFYVEDDYVYPN